MQLTQEETEEMRTIVSAYTSIWADTRYMNETLNKMEALKSDLERRLNENESLDKGFMDKIKEKYGEEFASANNLITYLHNGK